MDFGKLKYIDSRTHHLLFGYIHTSETELSLHMPELITSVCILYYYVFEHFTEHGPNIQLNNDKKIATVLRDDCVNTVYGNFKIVESLNAICSWSFKIIYISKNRCIGDMYIGIDSSCKGNVDVDFTESEECRYFAWGSGFAWFNRDLKDYGSPIDKDDIIKMEINTIDKTLKYYLNGLDQGVAFNNLFSNDETMYHMAVALDSKNTSVQLLEFQLKE